ncbi:MAG: hypothetical protein Kow0063_07920 [Anaerolineae bacterium]
MRRWFFLLMASLSLLLSACLSMPDTQLQPEAAGSPPFGQPIGSLTPDSARYGETPAPAPAHPTLDGESTAYPRATAVVWGGGFLWTANETGLLTRWDTETGDYQQYRLPGEPVIHVLISVGQHIYAGTQEGGIWRLDRDGAPTQIVGAATGTVTALAMDGNARLWYASAERGLVSVEPDGAGQVQHRTDHIDGDGNALQQVTALLVDREPGRLWVGTYPAGLLSYDIDQDRWRHHGHFDTDMGHNTINALAQGPDGTLWAATTSGVVAYTNGSWVSQPLVDISDNPTALSLAVAGDGTLWVAGQSYLAWMRAGEPWQVYRIADNPILAGRSRLVALDDAGHPWFIGRRGKLHFDGQDWTAYDADVRRAAQFTPFRPPWPAAPPPSEFPSPTGDYLGWLQTWPRPQADNGRGMHFLQAHQFDAIQAQRQVNRLKRLGVRWALVHYADHEQLVRTAPIFQEAGITVVWRPFVRPYGTYANWAEDVAFLRARGLAPYMQLYNEPSLAQEWDGHPVDREVYLRHLLPAVEQVYTAGGYVGLQFVNPDWLRSALRSMQAEGLDGIFDRLFFVAHLYGLNHPPDYDEDINGVLGFREFARVFQEEIGFVPVMIAGEGGWRPGEAQDKRYPAINEELHRDYHLAVFDWFRTGELSNGEPLPDYFFAFCSWLISDPDDPAAWYDSASGDRRLTIEAVEAMPAFQRTFRMVQ